MDFLSLLLNDLIRSFTFGLNLFFAAPDFQHTCGVNIVAWSIWEWASGSGDSGQFLRLQSSSFQSLSVVSVSITVTTAKMPTLSWLALAATSPFILCHRVKPFLNPGVWREVNRKRIVPTVAYAYPSPYLKNTVGLCHRWEYPHCREELRSDVLHMESSLQCLELNEQHRALWRHIMSRVGEQNTANSIVKYTEPVQYMYEPYLIPRSWQYWWNWMAPIMETHGTWRNRLLMVRLMRWNMKPQAGLQ